MVKNPFLRMSMGKI